VGAFQALRGVTGEGEGRAGFQVQPQLVQLHPLVVGVAVDLDPVDAPCPNRGFT
jgi:hypothetical protein